MSTHKEQYRRPNGKRIEGRGLAMEVSRGVVGLQLAAAFVAIRSAGFQINVNKLDGVPHPMYLSPDQDAVSVDVVAGIVQKSWAA